MKIRMVYKQKADKKHSVQYEMISATDENGKALDTKGLGGVYLSKDTGMTHHREIVITVEDK